MLPFALNQPPFQQRPEQTADAVAAHFMAAFALLANQPRALSESFAAILGAIGAAADNPLAIAGRNLAQDIDSGIGAGLGNAYHNRQHFCEVMLAAGFLSGAEGLDIDDRLAVVFAAMTHDFHHDGTNNGPTPFRLERLAYSAARPYLQAAGVDEARQEAIGALILATDVMHGIPVARASMAFHRQPASRPEIPSAAPELARLFDSRKLSRQALLLCEADILPSIGLGLDHALHLQDCLAREWNKPLGLEDKRRFIQDHFPGFVIGTFFQPNVERLLHALQEKIAAASLPLSR